MKVVVGNRLPKAKGGNFKVRIKYALKKEAKRWQKKWIGEK